MRNILGINNHSSSHPQTGPSTLRRRFGAPLLDGQLQRLEKWLPDMRDDLLVIAKEELALVVVAGARNDGLQDGLEGAGAG